MEVFIVSVIKIYKIYCSQFSFSVSFGKTPPHNILFVSPFWPVGIWIFCLKMDSRKCILGSWKKFFYLSQGGQSQVWQMSHFFFFLKGPLKGPWKVTWKVLERSLKFLERSLKVPKVPWKVPKGSWKVPKGSWKIPKGSCIISERSLKVPKT